MKLDREKTNEDRISKYNSLQQSKTDFGKEVFKHLGKTGLIIGCVGLSIWGTFKLGSWIVSKVSEKMQEDTRTDIDQLKQVNQQEGRIQERIQGLQDRRTAIQNKIKNLIDKQNKLKQQKQKLESNQKNQLSPIVGTFRY